jgi:cell fate regulator YaaT (PSP1 superfamily)
MALAVGVVFSPGGKVYSFDPNGLDLHWNEYVICQTSRGLEHGRVVQAKREHDEANGPPLRKIVRRATVRDAETVKKNQTAASEALRAFKLALRGNAEPGVRAVAAEIVFDGSRVVLSFRAEERLELKHLATSLQKEIGRRVELRQVNPREAARVCGSGGLCGERKCCNRFPSHEQPITLRMAKDQDLPMNPGRITGLCGRLRCCLAFEHPVYRSFRDRAPAVGRSVETPQGKGVVRSYKVLEDALMVRIEGAERDVEIPVNDAQELSAGGR